MRFFLPLTLILSITACTATSIAPSCDVEFSTDNLNEVQLAALDELIMNNEFLSGCVTLELEQLSDFSTTSCPLSHKPTLAFEQWQRVYTSCIAK